jgi:hypothetical protein
MQKLKLETQCCRDSYTIIFVNLVGPWSLVTVEQIVLTVTQINEKLAARGIQPIKMP